MLTLIHQHHRKCPPLGGVRGTSLVYYGLILVYDTRTGSCNAATCPLYSCANSPAPVFYSLIFLTVDLPPRFTSTSTTLAGTVSCSTEDDAMRLAITMPGTE